MSVLFPAPFSPMSAWTSPGRISRFTLRRAWVLPKLLRIPRILSLGAATVIRGLARLLCGVFQILIERRINKFLNLWLLHIFTRNHDYAGINSFFDLLFIEGLDDGHHAEVTHLHRILDDKSLNVAALQAFDRLRARIKSDQLDCPARLAQIFQREHHSNCDRFTWRKNPVHLLAVTI